MSSRGTSSDLWRHVCQLVLWTESSPGLNREELASRWVCTPRNVSYILKVAREQYGVRMVSERTARGNHGYMLKDAGVFDVASLRRHARRNGIR